MDYIIDESVGCGLVFIMNWACFGFGTVLSQCPPGESSGDATHYVTHINCESVTLVELIFFLVNFPGCSGVIVKNLGKFQGVR
jgi:hypothetical protein